MENVGVISGDVHFAQFYENDCSSHTGVKSLFEVTSSGLTHWFIQDVWATDNDMINEITLEGFAASPIFSFVNYGVFDIPIRKPVNDEDMVIRAQIRNHAGIPVFERKYTVADLRFDETHLRYGDLCHAKLEN